MRKVKNPNKKTKLLAILLVLILLISVGYAALTTNLTINGTAILKKQTWSVYFDNVQVKTGSVSGAKVITAPTTSGTTTTDLTWEVSMDTPGEFYEYNVDVVNGGTIDAMIQTATNAIVSSSLTEAQEKYLDYSIKYVNGADIEQYDKLAAGERKTITVKLLFKNDDTVNPEDLPTSAQNGITLSYSTNYVQADSNAVEKVTVNPVAITFNLNGGTVNNSTDSITANYLPGETINIPSPTAPSSTPSYKLKGWYDAATGGNLLIGKSATSITAPNSNTTYYAQWGEVLTYGETANLGTVTVNNTALLKGWKYFYNDGTNIYLIYENYLENAQIPASTENGIATDGYNVYVDINTYSGKSRQNLVDYLNNESTSTSGIWSGFAKGVQDALSAKGITATVKAKGAPTVEQFVGSYSTNYPSDDIDAVYRQLGEYVNGVSGETVNEEGYVYKKGTSWGYSQTLGKSENGKDLYFPETSAVIATGGTSNTYGYWLARPFCRILRSMRSGRCWNILLSLWVRLLQCATYSFNSNI